MGGQVGVLFIFQNPKSQKKIAMLWKIFDQPQYIVVF
jgi:hypothetical protein